MKEGVDNITQLVLVKSGDLSRGTIVAVTTVSGTATGIHIHIHILYTKQ